MDLLAALYKLLAFIIAFMPTKQNLVAHESNFRENLRKPHVV